MNGETNFSSFAGYRQMVMDLRLDLTRLKDYSKSLGLNNNVNSIEEVLHKSANDTFDVAVIGEFKRGKSTLINALIGKKVLPTDVLPTTATLNRVTYSITPFVKIEYKDGLSEEISIDMLPQYVTKLTDEAEKKSETIKQATVFYPTNYCKNNVDIIDTPGLNDDANMTEVTLSVLPEIDAALLVIMAQAPFSEYERDFLENKLLTSDLGRVLFVVTGIDRFDEEDAEKVIKNISDRITKYVIEKAKKVMGENSIEFEVYKRKLGKPSVFGVSSKQALTAKMNGDNDLLERSCFPQFEKELERFLTEDRGAVALQVQVNKILSASIEVMKTIELRENVLKMSKEEFEEKYSIAKQEIDEIRRKKDEEYLKINSASKTTFQDVRPQLDDFWPSIIENAMKIIDAETISDAEISKELADATQEKVMKKVKKSSEDLAQLLSEKIQNTISISLGNEIERLQDFEDEFFSSISNIRDSFKVYSPGNSDLGNVAISTGIGLLAGGGFGGIYVGFKAAGLKGALIGGAAGFGGAFGVAFILSALAIPITWPAVLAMSVVSAFTSKFVIGKFFQGSKTEKFKKALKELTVEKFKELEKSCDLLVSTKEQIATAFDALKNKIDQETENILKDTEDTLAVLQVKVTQNSFLAEREKEELKEMVNTVYNMAQRSTEINKNLLAVLNK